MKCKTKRFELYSLSRHRQSFQLSHYLAELKHTHTHGVDEDHELRHDELPRDVQEKTESTHGAKQDNSPTSAVVVYIFPFTLD